jgi:hypothetical protein
MSDIFKARSIIVPDKVLKIGILIDDYLNEFHKICSSAGVFTGNHDEDELIREFLNRFNANIVSLQNSLNLKDSIHATLLQRYNFELIVDFFYIFRSNDKVSEIDRFFTFERRSMKEKQREWSSIKMKDKKKSLPDLQNLDEHYRILSTLAHSNIMSMRVNRRSVDFEYKNILGALGLALTGINICLSEKNIEDKFVHVNFKQIRTNLNNITSDIIDIKNNITEEDLEY